MRYLAATLMVLAIGAGIIWHSEPWVLVASVVVGILGLGFLVINKEKEESIDKEDFDRPLKKSKDNLKKLKEKLKDNEKILDNTDQPSDDDVQSFIDRLRSRRKDD